MSDTPLNFKIAIRPAELIDMKPGAMKKVVKKAANEVAVAARRSIRTAVGTGRLYYFDGERHRASAPGQVPVNLTGALARAIKVFPFPSGEGAAIRDTEFYSLFLEKGAKGGGGNTANPANLLPAGELGRNGKILRLKNRMKASAIAKNRVLEPRPFLVPALQSREASIAVRVKEALIDGLEFRKAPR